ncbi:MAG: holo-ACP synthase [Actinobacteria bacterium]|nr:MAG: holo-ACP synthase [Actinomycetota bacterium]
MVKGIGIDIVDIDRFRAAIDKHPKLTKRLFSNGELSYCLSRPRPYFHFAVRFAAKEAVVKALGVGLRGMKWQDIEVKRTELGEPLVNLSGGAKKTAENLGVSSIKVSLSFSKESAIAAAIAE